MSRLLQDDFDAMCAKLARHPDEDVRKLVEEAIAARVSECEIFKHVGMSAVGGISGSECIQLAYGWMTSQFAEAAEEKIRKAGGDA